jgi:hypothetical protein
MEISAVVGSEGCQVKVKVEVEVEVEAFQKNLSFLAA